jgi:hypothetical protein
MPKSLQTISVINILGQQVQNINTQNQQNTYYSFDLSALGKGIYFVLCHFADGNITRKIILQ